MSSSLLDNVMSLLGPQVSGAVASQIGESSDVVQRGLEGGAAAILSGLASKVGNPGLISQIFGMLTGPQTSSALSGVIANPAGALTSEASASPLMELGNRFLALIFGSRTGAVTDAVAQYAGMSGGKAGALLSMAAPLVLGGLSRFLSNTHATPSALAGALQKEAPHLQGLLPGGFRSLLGELPGVGAAAAVLSTAEGTTSRWLWPVVLLAAVMLTGLWFINRNKQPAMKETMQNAADGTPSASALGSFFKTTLPSGVELNIPEFGVENKLLAFIRDDSKPVDDTTWFNFDRLTFDTGKATLQPSSQEQLDDIAEILRAYPKVHLKIGGYTDNTGDAAANMALSAERAKNVMNEVIAKGIDDWRLESEGYGDQHPLGDNATAEGRQANRRIALRVTQK